MSDSQAALAAELAMLREKIRTHNRLLFGAMRTLIDTVGRSQRWRQICGVHAGEATDLIWRELDALEKELEKQSLA